MRGRIIAAAIAALAAGVGMSLVVGPASGASGTTDTTITKTITTITTKEDPPPVPSGFTCSGKGLSLFGTDLGVANAPGATCVNASDTPIDTVKILGTTALPIGSVRAVGIAASSALLGVSADGTTKGPIAVGNGALAAATITLPGVSIVAHDLLAHTEARCNGGVPLFTDSGSIADLTLNGKTLSVDGSSDVSLGPLGALHINSTTKTASGVLRRALWLQTTLGDVVIGEATSGIYGTPCRS